MLAARFNIITSTILKVIQDECARSAGGDESETTAPDPFVPAAAPSLKILAHNNLIGRIIGKGGATIKKVMEDTGAKIAVSSINDISSFNMERVITVSAESVDVVSRAEADISARLRKAYEHDIAEVMVSMQLIRCTYIVIASYYNRPPPMQPHGGIFPGLHPAAVMSMPGMVASPSAGSAAPQQHMIGPAGGGPPPPVGHTNGNRHSPAAGSSPSTAFINGGGSRSNRFDAPYSPHVAAAAAAAAAHQQETTHLYVPNSAVGAIIGPKGNNIRYIMKFSGAAVKIAAPVEPTSESPSSDDHQTATAAAAATSRRVTITGTPEAQWKAQYLIFEKMCEEEFR